MCVHVRVRAAPFASKQAWKCAKKGEGRKLLAGSTFDSAGGNRCHNLPACPKVETNWFLRKQHGECMVSFFHSLSLKRVFCFSKAPIFNHFGFIKAQNSIWSRVWAQLSQMVVRKWPAIAVPLLVPGLRVQHFVWRKYSVVGNGQKLNVLCPWISVWIETTLSQDLEKSHDRVCVGGCIICFAP